MSNQYSQLTNVTENELENTIKSFKEDGASNVEFIKQTDGKYTVKATFKDNTNNAT